MNDETNATDSLLEELKNLSTYLKTDINSNQSLENIEEQSTSSMSTSSVSTMTQTITGFPSKINEENINDFILAKSEELITSALDTIAALKPIIAGTADAKSMAGFAEILKATTGAMDTLNAINIEKRKAKTTKEMKELDANTKKLLAAGQKPNNTVNIIAGRETIMKMLKSTEPAIDAEYVVKED